MKKLICVLASLVLMLALTPHAICAQSPQLVYPSVGEAVSYDELNALTVSADEGSEVSIFIDGELLAEYVATGTDEVSLSEKIAVGTHKAEIISNGTKTVSDFNVVKKESTVNYETDFTAGNFAGAGGGSAAVVGRDAQGANVMIAPTLFTGIDGDENGAAGFLMSKAYVEKTIYDSNGHYIIYLETRNYGWGDSGQISLEYDLKVFDKCMFEIETKNSAGKWGRPGGDILTKEGNISTSDTQYPINEWMHVEQTIDLDKDIQYLKVDGVTYLNGTSVADADNIIQLKLQYYVRYGAAGQGCAVDNVKISHSKIYGGFDAMSFVTQGGINIPVDAAAVSPTVTRLRFKPSSSYVAGGDASANVTAKMGRNNLKIKSAAVAVDGSLTVEFERHLPADSEILLNFTAPDKTIAYSKMFKTDSVSLGIKSVKFKNGETELYLNKQLLGLSKCTAVVELKDITGSAKSGVLCAAVYDGERLIDFKTADAVANGNPVSIDLTLDENAENPLVELYLIDSFSVRHALSSVWSLR